MLRAGKSCLADLPFGRNSTNSATPVAMVGTFDDKGVYAAVSNLGQSRLSLAAVFLVSRVLPTDPATAMPASAFDRAPRVVGEKPIAIDGAQVLFATAGRSLAWG